LTSISVRDLTYRYEDGTLALDALSFEVSEGERLAILGPNGAGKSTLFELLMGLRFPQAGSIQIMGQDLDRKTAGQLRRHMGLVFQDPDDQIFMPRVWDDLAFGPINMGLGEAVVRERVRKALASTGLVGFEQRAPHNLSRGEKKRVAIAGVLAMEPQIMFLDEPTTELDLKGRRDLIGVLNGLHTTMLVATHEVQTALEITDRAIVIDHSKLGEGTYPELLSNRDLLDRASLEVPPIPKLFKLLEEDGIPLGRATSVQEAAGILRKALLNSS